MDRLDREIRGRRIRQVREHNRRMSRRELAQRVPGQKGTTTEKQIERIENGEWDTDDAMIDAIADALAIPRDELDGDLRMLRLPGYTEMRREIALIWTVLQVEFSDTAARIADEYDAVPPPEPPKVTAEELERLRAEMRRIERRARGQDDDTPGSPPSDPDSDQPPPAPA